jgi:hypothetical protein
VRKQQDCPKPHGKGAVTAGLEFLNYDKIEREVEKFGLARDTVLALN